MGHPSSFFLPAGLNYSSHWLTKPKSLLFRGNLLVEINSADFVPIDSPSFNHSLICLKFKEALAKLSEHMHKKFEVNRTKIKGSCRIYFYQWVVSIIHKKCRPLKILLEKKNNGYVHVILCRRKFSDFNSVVYWIFYWKVPHGRTYYLIFISG